MSEHEREREEGGHAETVARFFDLFGMDGLATWFLNMPNPGAFEAVASAVPFRNGFDGPTCGPAVGRLFEDAQSVEIGGLEGAYVAVEVELARWGIQDGSERLLSPEERALCAARVVKWGAEMGTCVAQVWQVIEDGVVRVLENAVGPNPDKVHLIWG